MESEVQSPYIRSSNDTLYDQGSSYRQSQDQSRNTQGLSSLRNDTEPYNYSMIVVLVIIIIIVILCYYYNSSEGFVVSGIRTDPASDSYLDKQIDTLNKMQKHNLSK